MRAGIGLSDLTFPHEKHVTTLRFSIRGSDSAAIVNGSIEKVGYGFGMEGGRGREVRK